MNAATDEAENANTLTFGKVDFEAVQTLSNDEMYLVLLDRQRNSGFSNE
jgi:hypothetical protein